MLSLDFLDDVRRMNKRQVRIAALVSATDLSLCTEAHLRANRN